MQLGAEASAFALIFCVINVIIFIKCCHRNLFYKNESLG
jgi:hypothetical protein